MASPSSVVVKIDYREHALIALLQQRGVLILEVGPLDVGDIYIGTELVLERKTEADLCASIRDGRWREQKTRLDLLKAADPNVQVGFLIEQVEPAKRTALDFAMLQAALVNTVFRDHSLVLYSECLAQTAEYIELLHKKVVNGDFHKPRASALEIEAGLLKKKMGKNEYTQLVLAAIPRVSVETAKHIVALYPTLDALLQAFKTAGPNLLADILLNKRRLGPKLSADIYSFLI
jgi:ERCC4-type nuclease